VNARAHRGRSDATIGNEVSGGLCGAGVWAACDPVVEGSRPGKRRDGPEGMAAPSRPCQGASKRKPDYQLAGALVHSWLTTEPVVSLRVKRPWRSREAAGVAEGGVERRARAAMTSHSGCDVLPRCGALAMDRRTSTRFLRGTRLAGASTRRPVSLEASSPSSHLENDR